MKRGPKTFADIAKLEFRTPRKGDRLLHRIGDWDKGVQFADDSKSRHVFLWDGFMTAGKVLLDDHLDNPQDQHILVYPALFNYRHGIELAMKWMLTRYGGVTADSIASHNLLELWRATKELADGFGESEDTLIVERVVRDFHNLDRSSTAFRYPTNKNETTIPMPSGFFDLRKTREVMEGVALYFDGLDAMISDLPSERFD
jgi:hypothetical protein